MRNADMPAMPSDVKDVYAAMTDTRDSWGKGALGLTKREMIAIHALNGLMVAYNVEDVAMGGESLVKDAVWYADALLAELERTK